MKSHVIGQARILAFILAAAATTACGAEPDADNVIAEFPVFNDGDALLLPVRLEGPKRDRLVVLDTGASQTVYDTALLGEPVEHQSVTATEGEVQLGVYRGPGAWVGKVWLSTSGGVAEAGHAAVRRVSGHAVYGCLGMDFLRHRVVKVDFDRGRLQLLRSAGRPQGEAVRLAYAGTGCPYVAAELPGVGLTRFFLDTGAVGSPAGDLDRRAVGRLRRADALEERQAVKTLSANGGATKGSYRLTTLHRAGHDCRDLWFGDRQGHNALGLPFLAMFNLVFDFPTRSSTSVRRGGPAVAVGEPPEAVRQGAGPGDPRPAGRGPRPARRRRPGRLRGAGPAAGSKDDCEVIRAGGR